jgi:hypothetical protein
MVIVQDVAVPIQLVYAVYVVPSLCRISTVYPVIAEPPSAGAVQAIETLLPATVVVGAAGVEGTVAGIVNVMLS